MKTKSSIILSAFFISSLFLSVSCGKETGGAATIVAFPEHHGKAIYGATVYVKYNAVDLPSDPTKNYDQVVKGDAKEEHVHIVGLHDVHSSKGEFYLYAVGYDSAISLPVKGGLGVKIEWSEKDQEKDVHVAVTE